MFFPRNANGRALWRKTFFFSCSICTRVLQKVLDLIQRWRWYMIKIPIDHVRYVLPLKNSMVFTSKCLHVIFPQTWRLTREMARCTIFYVLKRDLNSLTYNKKIVRTLCQTNIFSNRPRIIIIFFLIKDVLYLFVYINAKTKAERRRPLFVYSYGFLHLYYSVLPGAKNMITSPV